MQPFGARPGGLLEEGVDVTRLEGKETKPCRKLLLAQAIGELVGGIAALLGCDRLRSIQVRVHGPAPIILCLEKLRAPWKPESQFRKLLTRRWMILAMGIGRLEGRVDGARRTA